MAKFGDSQPFVFVEFIANREPPDLECRRRVWNGAGPIIEIIELFFTRLPGCLKHANCR
jgi:hypothetical protein